MTEQSNKRDWQTDDADMGRGVPEPEPIWPEPEPEYDDDATPQVHHEFESSAGILEEPESDADDAVAQTADVGRLRPPQIGWNEPAEDEEVLVGNAVGGIQDAFEPSEKRSAFEPKLAVREWRREPSATITLDNASLDEAEDLSWADASADVWENRISGIRAPFATQVADEVESEEFGAFHADHSSTYQRRTGLPESLALGSERLAISKRVSAESEEEISRLWQHIFFSTRHAPPKSIMVTSARPGDGATQIAAALALFGATAHRDLRIVLVDFNLRNPQIASVLGIDASPGLSEVLEGRARLESAMRRVELLAGGELQVLTGGAAVAQPSGLVRSRAASLVLAQLSEAYDHVLIDLPASNAYPDPQIIGRETEGAVMVARCGSTPRETVAEARSRLSNAGVRCLGLVLNQSAIDANALSGS